MNIQDFKNSLPYLFKAELTGFVWGHAGIGKSSLVKQYAEENGMKFFPFYLGTQSDLGDILGLAEFVDNGDGSKSTAFAIPKWMNDTIKYCNDNPDSGAIIFLDEFNRARKDILNGMFSLALDKTFHTVKLPKNCHVIAAGNPPTDEYFTTDVDETALMARFVHIKLEPTLQEWIEYAKGEDMEKTLVEFIRNQPELLEEQRKEFKLPVKVDRRAWSRLDKLFNLETPHNLLEQLMQGIIGLERTVAYQQFLKDADKPLTAEEVLTGKKRNLLEKWGNPNDVVASLLNLTCDNVNDHVVKLTETKTNLTKDEKNYLMDFLEMIPKDISFPLITKLVTARTDTAKDFYSDKDYESRLSALIMAARGKKVEE